MGIGLYAARREQAEKQRAVRPLDLTYHGACLALPIRPLARLLRFGNAAAGKWFIARDDALLLM
jgi:hypothetical protein